MLQMMELFSNSSNTDGVNEARKIHAVALREASLVPDVYLSTVDFEIAHGTVITLRLQVSALLMLMI